MDEIIKLVIQQEFTVSTTQEWTYINSGPEIQCFNLKRYV